MDHAAVLALFDRDMREGARPDGPGARVERVGGVVRQIGSEQGWSGVVWSDLDEAGADAAITEQIRYFSGLGRECSAARDDDDDDGPRPSAGAVVARLFPFFRPAGGFALA